MKVGDPVKFTKEVDPNATEIGFVIVKPYASIMNNGNLTVETKVVDVLFGVDIVEKVPLDCLEIIF